MISRKRYLMLAFGLVTSTAAMSVTAKPAVAEEAGGECSTCADDNSGDFAQHSHGANCCASGSTCFTLGKHTSLGSYSYSCSVAHTLCSAQ
jgi:hypothetical protein